MSQRERLLNFHYMITHFYKLGAKVGKQICKSAIHKLSDVKTRDETRVLIFFIKDRILSRGLDLQIEQLDAITRKSANNN